MTASTNFPRKKKREVNFLPGFKRRINLLYTLLFFPPQRKGKLQQQNTACKKRKSLFFSRKKGRESVCKGNRLSWALFSSSSSSVVVSKSRPASAAAWRREKPPPHLLFPQNENTPFPPLSSPPRLNSTWNSAKPFAVYPPPPKKKKNQRKPPLPLSQKNGTKYPK